MLSRYAEIHFGTWPMRRSRVAESPNTAVEMRTPYGLRRFWA